MVKSDEVIKRILSDSKVIAVVGCSSNPSKAAHDVPMRLKSYGYRIIPVNPNRDEILGEKCFDKVSEIEEPVDVVEIFRPSDQVLPVVEEAIKIKPKVIWMQLGIVNEEAARLAESHGIEVVMDRCMHVDYKRLMP